MGQREACAQKRPFDVHCHTLAWRGALSSHRSLVGKPEMTPVVWQDWAC